MRFLMTIVFCFVLGFTFAQVRSLEYTIVDEETKKPIPDVHVFIGNATFGTVSDEDGVCKFDVPADLMKELVISHISYDLLVLKYSKYNIFKTGDTISLKPNGIDLDEIVIKGSKAKQWKKNYRKFSKAFIGSGKQAALCEILNPEVLRFSNDDGKFTATAVDILKIKNYYLGYDVDFRLEELSISNDGSMKYFGYPKFTDRSLTTNRKEIEENRREAYTRSINHFLLNLIDDNLEDAKYSIKIKRYTGSEFKDVSRPESNDIVRLDSASGLYHIIYDNYLEVKHLSIKQLVDKSVGLASGGIESQVFGSNYQGENQRLRHPISMIYKKGSSLIVDKYGQIINQRSVQEYGYWAQRRIANLLPFDYGFLVDPRAEEVTEGIVDRIPVIELDTTSVTITHSLLYGDKQERNNILDYVERSWKVSYIPLLLDVNNVITSEDLNPRIIEILASKAKIYNYYDGLQWMWAGEPIYDEYYLENKAEIYQHVDPLFKSYFHGQQNTEKISLDEIVWGGVTHNSIPQLKIPKMLSAEDAEYLDDNDIVFGLFIDGEAKAYPKRILGWHEFFVDKIGAKSVAGVYCTLCGTMIAYEMHHRNQIHDLNTSGFLYMSNKLMYDKKTKSLWSTIDGEPVLGPLTKKGIKLKSFPIVTTEWKNWKKKHPETKVLDINTGYDRDYSEGAAYKSYFSNQNLMFPVPLEDDRLKRKDEVLIIRSSRFKTDPLAISIKYLKKKRLHQDVIADKNVIAITEKDGATRAYFSKNVKFKSYKKGILIDQKDRTWTAHEEYLQSESGRKLLRVPSHNVFWFAWLNMYPETRLVK